jgi:hypothetical protein
VIMRVKEGDNVGGRGRGRRGRSGNKHGCDDCVMRRVKKMKIEVDTGFRELDYNDAMDGIMEQQR